MNYLLSFETEIESIEASISQLRGGDSAEASQVLARVADLEKKREKALATIYQKLDDWQVCQVARHLKRPQSLDYIRTLTTNFMELHGDRLYADDRAIITGLASFDGQAVAVVGHQKGGDTNSKIEHNFGMAGPEGYRKVLRLMDMAQKFHLPIISFIDTPGAYPGIGAEQRGQSNAIGACLRRCADLKTPILAVVIGEGGSGGALALGVGDYIGMLKYAIYSVISPEGCASILWKDATKAQAAAKILGLTATKLKKFKLIDEIIGEPLGGAHRQPEETITSVGASLQKILTKLLRFDGDKLLALRQQRWRHYGSFKEV